MTPTFESERDGVRLYPNRVELDSHGMLGTKTRTVYLHDVAELRYDGSKAVTLVTKIRTAVGIGFRKREAARQFVDALNSVMPGPVA